ncbi:MAG TPA: hypothetical protein VFE58_03930 [Tepidisphaeraceae bacterium]|nr:hypothetical protein [Tepidisphaeraceae bacterium]
MKMLHAIMAAAPLFLAATTFAQSWSLANDFNGVDNPNGVWSYGYRDSGSFVSFGTGSGSGYGSGYLAISKNTAATPGYGIDPGQIALEADGGTPDARFIAQFASTYHFALDIGGTEAGEGGGYGNHDAQNAGLLINGTPVPGTYDPATNTYSWSFDQSLSPGDTVDAYVGAGFGGGNTQAIFNISVPEPASLSLLLTPALFLRRKRP